MKNLVIVEHDNKTIKPSTYSTITAASKISQEVYAIILGSDIESALEDLKKCNHLKKIFFVNNKELTEHMKSIFIYFKIFRRQKLYSYLFSIYNVWQKFVTKDICRIRRTANI